MEITIDAKLLTIDLGFTDAQLNRVERQVVNRIVRNIHKRTGGEVPRLVGTQVAGFRRVRNKKNRLKAKGHGVSGSVWVGGNEISARFGGRMRNVKGGAYAGRHFFKNSFKGAVRNGKYTSIWKRLANGKLKEQKISMNGYAEVVKRIGREELKNVEPYLVQEINKVLATKAKRKRKLKK